ncbi:MAG: ribose 5-phosphate isomerase B [Micavibrio sp.]|nr:ribose 5-phosphate isomerase B [Micavibrio sp.]|tara:strand:+ start:735 stop:1160 length:426 start_codon:yes stop_codon:yes gene_type:complete
MKKTLAIACDHGGYELKAAIKAKFPEIEWKDLGCDSTESVDYPDYAAKMIDAIETGSVEQGILICGTGIGISIAANRSSKIRAALCTDTTMARLTRQHNDANVLALGARITGVEAAFDIVDIFVKTEFEGGRHERRIAKMS